MDDCVLVHKDLGALKSLIPIIKNYLQEHLQLTLHPNKIYVQHYSKGVQFLGTVIKPQRIYIAKRTKSNFYTGIQKHNVVKEHKPDKEARLQIACRLCRLCPGVTVKDIIILKFLSIFEKSASVTV